MRIGFDFAALLKELDEFPKSMTALWLTVDITYIQNKMNK